MLLREGLVKVQWVDIAMPRTKCEEGYEKFVAASFIKLENSHLQVTMLEVSTMRPFNWVELFGLKLFWIAYMSKSAT